MAKVQIPSTRGALSIQNIVDGAKISSGINDVARSEESVERSNTIYGDQLGTGGAVPNFTPEPVALNPTIESITAGIQNAQGMLDNIVAQENQTGQVGQPTDLRGQLQQGMVDMLNSEGVDRQGIRDSYGLADKEKLARDLSNEATAIKRDYEAQIRDLKKNPEGMLRGALQHEINNLTEKGNLALSEKMFQYSIANGDFQQAQKLAQQTISDMEKADDRKLKMFETAWNFVQNDLSESEKLAITQNFEEQQAERNFERQKLMSQFNYNLGASQRAFDNQMRLAGLNTVIDRGDGNKQLINTMTGEVIAEYGTGDLEGVEPFVKGSLEEAKAQEQTNAIAQLATHSGFNNAVGANPAGRWGTPFSGDKEAFVGTLENMLDVLTLNTYAEAKAKGMTFGAMSEGEWDILASSASRITNWRVKDERGGFLGLGKGSGKVVGYDIDHDTMRDELDTLTQYAKLSFINKGGDPASVGVVVTEDGYFTQNSDGSITKIR